jgi:hypothetical protein
MVTVPGDVVERGSIESLSTDKGLYLFGGDVKIDTRINNSGNIHFKPTGTITIKDTFGNEATKLKLNPESGNVLPGSTRSFQNIWNLNWYTFGRFTVNLAAYYGDSGSSLKSSFVFWVIPFWLIILLVVVLGLLIFLLFKLIKVLKNSSKKRARKITDDQKKIILR